MTGGVDPGLLNPRTSEVLRFLFGGKAPTGLIRDLVVTPVIPSHRNQVREAPFFLSADRLGGDRDLPLVPLMRRVVDESLSAFSSFFPAVQEEVGRSPISPHGSMYNSIREWGIIDWDFVRDLDWRIYLPPQIGHESGFMSYLRDSLDRAVREAGYRPLIRGKDPEGRPQVQLQDAVSGVIHGFHLFLLSMEPGFVKRSLHEGGGYSIHQAYFPENAVDRALENSGVLWDGLIGRQREHYVEMFRRVSFNTFAGDDPASQRLKTPGWYSRKAFKWYAALAGLRGLFALEKELLDAYKSFDGTHEELVHLIRLHYYALLDPASSEMRRLDRELSFALSVAYARGRSPEGDDCAGRQTPATGAKVLILEPLPEDWFADALRCIRGRQPALSKAQEARLSALHNLGTQQRIRFADGIGEPGIHRFVDGETGLLLPSVWSFVFSASYIRRAATAARQAGEAYDESEIRGALAALLAGFLLVGG